MRLWLVPLLVVALLVPPVPAQEDVVQDILSREGSPITFYGHLFSIGRTNPMPMNTQFPVNADDYSRGFFGACGTFQGVPVWPLAGPAGYDGPCEDWGFNEAWLYTTAGFVQVKSADEWSGYEQFHNERGQTKDIFLDTSQPVTAQFWMSADWHGWSTAFSQVGAGWNWDPGYFQDWVVEATVYHASLGEWSTDPSARPDVSDIPALGPEVTQVAYGRTEPADMVSFDETLPVPLCEAACQTVHPFDIELAWEDGFDGVVPYENDLLVRFQWYQETDGERYILTPGYQVSLAWNVNAGEDYPPSITLPARNPLDVELVFPRFVHDKLVVLAIINTPWGSYDIDPELTTLTIRDSAGDVVPVQDQHLQAHVDASVAHSGHYKPINATWVWDYQAQGLAPGDYSATVGATNFQNSFSTSTAASFSITAEGSGGTTTAGRSGLASYSQQEFEEFSRGASSGVDDAVQDTDHDAQSDSRGSPAVPLVMAGLAVLGLAAWRRRK